MNGKFLPLSHMQDTLGRISCFKTWRKEQLALLASGARNVVVEKNVPLVRKGRRVDSLYVVLSGQMRLFIPLPNGMERVVALMGAGDSFGESCLVLEEPCPYDIIAGKKTHLLSIDGLIFRQELHTNHAYAECILEQVCRRLMETLRDTEICAQRLSIHKVATFLLQFRTGAGGEGFEVRLPARKRDIAARLGISQETFSRTLGFMNKQGLIHVEGGLIRVRDAHTLAAINATDCQHTPAEHQDVS